MDAGLQQAAFLARLHHLEWVARACDAARELNHTREADGWAAATAADPSADI